MHSKHYEKVRSYWKEKLWNEAKVRKAVEKQWITAEEFREITGMVY